MLQNNYASRHIKRDLTPEPIKYHLVELNDGNGHIALVDPTTQNDFDLKDFRLRTLLENGVDLKEMPMILSDNLSAADQFNFMFTDFVNLEKSVVNTQDNEKQ